MLSLYRSLLYLYPRAYRLEYADEMLSVLSEVQHELQKNSAVRKTVLCAQEAGGLLAGALREHLHALTGSYYPMLSPRRITMRSEFRFPKTVVVLMIVVLAAVLAAIDKARSIMLSVPHTSQPVGPIKEAEFTTVPTMLIALAGACLAGLLGWAIVFTLRRSGIQRFSQVNPSQNQRTGR